MADLKNTFSWSWSRHRAFQTCRRLYWHQHYGFWGGWEASSPAREIYVQKKLNSRPQWIGTTVHGAVEWVLGQVVRGNYPEPERVVERFRRKAWRDIEDSARGLYRHMPKKAPGFVDHYYALETPDEVWQADVDEIARQVANVFENPVFLRLSRVPERIVEFERLEQVVVDDVPVWVSLDVLVGDGEGGLVVIDWKTGKEHDTETVVRQLGVYGVYVMDRYFQVPPLSEGPRPVDRIKAMYVNLRETHHEVRTVDPELLDNTVRTIRDSAEAMRSALVRPFENEGRIEDFPMTEEGARACSWCPYRRTCGRE